MIPAATTPKSVLTQLVKSGSKFGPSSPTEYDVAVIGSGLGGLATANLLARQGLKVAVFESHYAIGGFAHTYSNNGHIWNAGAHYIGQVHKLKSPLRKLTDYLTDQNLQFDKIPDPYDQFTFTTPDGQSKTFSAPKNKADAIQTLKTDYPHEAEHIDTYFSWLKKANSWATVLFLLNALPQNLRSWRISKWIAEQAHFYTDKTTEEVLSQWFSDPELKARLTAQWGDYGLPPAQSSFTEHALVTNHYLDGANYPVGGSGAVAAFIAQGLLENGGKIFVRTPVVKILTKSGVASGIELDDGTIISAKIVISNAGVTKTYGELLPGKKIESDPSIPHVSVNLVLKKTDAELGLKAGNHWIFPQGFDFNTAFKNFISNPNSSEIPVYFISFSSAKEQNSAEEKSTSQIEFVIPIHPDSVAQWKSLSPGARKNNPAYQDWKKQIAKKAIAQLVKHHPQITKEMTASIDVSSPLSTTRYVASSEIGEIYGQAASPNRFRAWWFSARSHIKNLFLTGADTLNFGVGGAIMSALFTSFIALGPKKGVKMLASIFLKKNSKN